METTGLYLLKSAVWLAGFTLVFLLLLRDERYFGLNRIYLLAGIAASLVFPFYTWHYPVILPVSPPAVEIGLPEISTQTVAPAPIAIPVYWWFYFAGIAFFAFRLLWQTGKVIRKLKLTGYERSGPVKLVRTPEYDGSFSFFSYVFVNPSITDIETKEIVNHESEHIQQRHWFDLLLVELLCLVQWFNPFVWIYARFIRQNHEYLADERALQRAADPAIYQATLLNQLLGTPVINLANSFSYSLNKKRFTMMKKKIDSPFRKLKMLLVLPFVGLVFYAFAEPEYITSVPLPATEKTTTIAEAFNVLNTPSSLPADIPEKTIATKKAKIVKGTVINPDNRPLPGASVIIAGTHIGTITDAYGIFELKDVPKNGELVFSFIGYTTQKAKPDFDQPMVIKMAKQNVGIDGVVVVGYGIPKTSTTVKTLDSKNPPIYVVDGSIVSETIFKAINPELIQSVNVIKDQSLTSKYGEAAKNGVIEISLKKSGGDIKTSKVDTSRNTTAVRGINSDNPPLIVLDGEIISKEAMEKIEPADIESVTVLKDQSATSMYGGKGKNGVVSIISKKGAAAKKTDTDGIAESDNNQGKGKEVFIVVEQMPKFPGGDMALRKFIARSIKYPVVAQKAGVQGKVFVTFVVNSNGKVENAKIAQGIDPSLDAEAIRVVNSLPDWIPGRQRGQTVNVSYTIPIQFMLQTGSAESQVKKEQVFLVVDEMPQFAGGEQKLNEFIAKNINYPSQAKKDKAEGKVFVSFVVRKNGKVENPRVVRGVHPALDAEAIRVVNLLPEWKPGKQKGVAVDVACTIPVQFTR